MAICRLEKIAELLQTNNNSVFDRHERFKWCHYQFAPHDTKQRCQRHHTRSHLLVIWKSKSKKQIAIEKITTKQADKATSQLLSQLWITSNGHRTIIFICDKRWSNRFRMPCQSARSMPQGNNFEKLERLRKLMLGWKKSLGLKLVEGIKCGTNLSTKPSCDKIFPITTVLVVNFAAFFREAYNRDFRRQNWTLVPESSWRQV